MFHSIINGNSPSRSSLHRYLKGFKDMMQSLDEIETASRVMIEEFARCWR